jgi:hypothetical protein
VLVVVAQLVTAPNRPPRAEGVPRRRHNHLNVSQILYEAQVVLLVSKGELCEDDWASLLHEKLLDGQLPRGVELEAAVEGGDGVRLAEGGCAYKVLRFTNC